MTRRVSQPATTKNIENKNHVTIVSLDCFRVKDSHDQDAMLCEKRPWPMPLG